MKSHTAMEWVPLSVRCLTAGIACTKYDRSTRLWRCCAQIDSALLSHPLVTEAVSFGAPDEKYGESVAAAVVLSRSLRMTCRRH